MKSATVRVTGGDSVTDLATRPEASSEDAAAVATATASVQPEAQWAAPDTTAPKSRAKRVWIGAGITAGALLVGGATVASLMLIAPGTTVAGVDVGLMTPDAAADAIGARLAETSVTVGGAAGDIVLTGKDLGASVDASAVAAATFDARPAWNVTQWFGPADTAPVTFDPAATSAALEAGAPNAYLAPVDAQLTYDADSTLYTVVPGVNGTGINPESITTAVEAAFAQGSLTTSVEADATSFAPAMTTEVATAEAARLNAMFDSMGFYVGDERTIPIDRAVAASWLTVTPDPATGAFAVDADAATIQATVDALPAAINREVVNATVITSKTGKVLRTVKEGFTGRTVGDTSTLAGDYAAQIEGGNGVYALTVTEVPFTTTTLKRTVEVNLTTQQTFTYENDVLVNTYMISSGLGEGNVTPTGNFNVFAHVGMQNMGCVPGYDYCTKDVPWVTYFSPDIAFHGTYWHNNFGQPMSHGCVNMRVEEAKALYDWMPHGTDVWVHY